jgi:hypothetical protein
MTAATSLESSVIGSNIVRKLTIIEAMSAKFEFLRKGYVM